MAWTRAWIIRRTYHVARAPEPAVALEVRRGRDSLAGETKNKNLWVVLEHFLQGLSRPRAHLLWRGGRVVYGARLKIGWDAVTSPQVRILSPPPINPSIRVRMI